MRFVIEKFGYAEADVKVRGVSFTHQGSVSTDTLSRV